jgi:PIN domain nuclease of toxin-antitoxin system
VTLLLDTHALLWFASHSEKLSDRSKAEIEVAEHLYVSSISAWEIGMLVAKERLILAYDVEEWIRLTQQIPKVRWLTINPEIALKASSLPGSFHGDPADRIITASAISLGASLITADQKIQSYRHVRTIW